MRWRKRISGTLRKQRSRRDSRRPAFRQLIAHHDRGGAGVAVGVNHPAQRRRQFPVHAFVRIEADDPASRRCRQRGVAGGGKVVTPREIDHLTAGGADQVRRAVQRAGIGNDQFVPEPGHRCQESGQHGGLVAHDHAQAQVAIGHGIPFARRPVGEAAFPSFGHGTCKNGA
jgi:hypothetical protein